MNLAKLCKIVIQLIWILSVFSRVVLRYFSHRNKQWRNILCGTLESKVSGKVFCSNIYLFDVCYSMRGYTSVFAYYPQSEQKQCCSVLFSAERRQKSGEKYHYSTYCFHNLSLVTLDMLKFQITSFFFLLH